MPEIVLSTFNARFIHASFGLRYLLANLGDLRSRAEIVEFEIKQAPLEIVEGLLARTPRIIGLGVYIWNVRQTTEVVALLKRLRPDVTVILGGPEVSHETDEQEIVALADHTVCGEADLVFASLCRALLDPCGPVATAGARGAVGQASDFSRTRALAAIAGISTPPHSSSPNGIPRILSAPLPDLAQVNLPYDHYTDADLAHRVIYVEASRGCPFSCEFCLSSLDIPVRAFPLEPFLAAMGRLLERGARQFKFVDRTFNLNLATSRAILGFFRERWRDGLFLHFEMIPDRLPEPLREEIGRFPPGCLQFEIGIQSFNPDVCALIGRRQDPQRTEENLRFLRGKPGVHLHADLIAGLPGESLASLAAGFDRLVDLGPQEIQFGMLKRLRGTPIVRHDAEWGMRYSPLPPYEILENRLLDFPTMQRLRRFARYWDLVANSGRFPITTPLFWSGGRSPFWSFLEFCDWLYAETRQTHGIALDRLAELIFRWLGNQPGITPEAAREALTSDLKRSGRRDLPGWLAESNPAPAGPLGRRTGVRSARRQARHRAGEASAVLVSHASGGGGES